MFTRLPNGLRLIVIPFKNRATVYFDLAIETGSRWETKEENGLSHLAEHVVSDAALETLPKNTWNSHSIASDFQAITHDRRMNFECTAHKNDIATALRFLAACVETNGITSARLKKERARVLTEIKETIHDPFERHAKRLRAAVFGTHPLVRPILGTPANVSRFTADDLVRYVRARLRPERAVLTVAGDVSAARVAALAKKLFRFASRTPHADFRTMAPRHRTRVVRESVSNLGAVAFAWMFPPSSPETNVRQEFCLSLFQGYLRERLEPVIGSYTLWTDVTAYADFTAFSVGSNVAKPKIDAFLAGVRRALTAFPKSLTDRIVATAVEQGLIDLELSEDSERFHANTAAWYELTFGTRMTSSRLARILRETKKNDLVACMERLRKTVPTVVVSRI